jgi:DNA polymerase-3 subunit delta'
MTNHIVDTLPWLQSSWSQLNRYIIENRIPQALLMIGKNGMGKRFLAEYYAQSLLCSSQQSSQDFCGQCQSCLLFKAKTHPDFIFIESNEPGKAIGISVIRQLITRLELKPQFEGYRVVVINQAESLNNAAANAFLKYLEEPTERTCLVLITHSPSKLPATILSRCQKLVLSVPDKAGLAEWLNQQGIIDNHELILNLSQGSPLLAKQFAQTDLINLRAQCFEQWLKLSNLADNFVEIADQWNKLEKKEIDFLLFWLISWVIDVMKLAYQQQANNLFNPDLRSSLQDLAQKLNLKELYNYYDLLLVSQNSLDKQLNKQLMFEQILIHWLKLNSK